MGHAIGTAGAVVLVGLAGTVHGQPERPALQRLGMGIEVEPLRVAQAVYADGVLKRVGEWMPYAGLRAQHDVCFDYRIFDSYGDADANAVPDDLGGCNMGSSRWFFGTGYCSAFYTNDMVLAPDTMLSEGAWRADLAWQWTCAGYEQEQCVIAIFTHRSNADACEPDSFDYPGWLFDFGDLDCNTGGYRYSSIDISALGRWQLPPEERGSYSVMFLSDDGTALASCAQTMLWGTPDAGGTPGGVGTQGSGQMEDDAPGDWYHDPVQECYTYSFGTCPDPLGGMLQFWGERDADLWHRADFNRDNLVDTRDFVAFLNAWHACSFGADCTGNNRCTSADVLCYLDLWNSCPR